MCAKDSFEGVKVLKTNPNKVTFKKELKENSILVEVLGIVSPLSANGVNINPVSYNETRQLSQ